MASLKDLLVTGPARIVGKIFSTGGFSGPGSELTSLNGSNISSGTVPYARLPVGTGASQVAQGSHTHSYLPLSGGTLTGAVSGTDLTLSNNLNVDKNITVDGEPWIPTFKTNAIANFVVPNGVNDCIVMDESNSVNNGLHHSNQMLSVPIGTILDFAGATTPNGYLECNGAAVSRTTYAALFSVLGTTWGSGDGSTTFNLPDLRGRTAIGAGTGDAGGATAHNLGTKGGDERLQSHSHEHSIKATTPKFTHSITQPAFTMINHVHSNTHNHTQAAHNHGVVITGSNAVAGSGFQYIYSSSKTMQNYYGANDMVKNATPTINNYTGNTGNPTSLGGLTRSTNVGVGDHSATDCTMSGSVSSEGAGGGANMPPFATVKKIVRAF